MRVRCVVLREVGQQEGVLCERARCGGGGAKPLKASFSWKPARNSLRLGTVSGAGASRERLVQFGGWYSGVAGRHGRG